MGGNRRVRDPSAWIAWAGVFYAGVAAVGLLWNALAGTPWAFRDPAAAARGVWWSGDVALGVATALAVVAGSHAITEHTRWGEALGRALGELLGPLSLGRCLWLAAVSGFAEEVFFRGALQPRVGWAAASLLFGLAHFVPRRDLWPWTLFAVVAGGLLGGLYEATGNLVAPVVAHAGVNAVNLRLLARRYGSPHPAGGPGAG